MKNKKFLLLVILLAVVLVGATAGYRMLSERYTPQSAPEVTVQEEVSEEKAQEEVQEPQLQPAPNFAVLDDKQKSVSLLDYAGKPVLINFWATWCGPCASEMPAFDAAFAEYGEDIQFMMINLTDGGRDTVESVQTYMEENGYSFPVYYDTEMNAMKTYGAYSIPMTVLVDAEGNLLGGYRGALPESILQEGIDLLLAE